MVSDKFRNTPSFVMPGLDPGIQGYKRLDPRVTPGDDKLK